MCDVQGKNQRQKDRDQGGGGSWRSTRRKNVNKCQLLLNWKSELFYYRSATGKTGARNCWGKEGGGGGQKKTSCCPEGKLFFIESSCSRSRELRRTCGREGGRSGGFFLRVTKGIIWEKESRGFPRSGLEKKKEKTSALLKVVSRLQNIS